MSRFLVWLLDRWTFRRATIALPADVAAELAAEVRRGLPTERGAL